LKLGFKELEKETQDICSQKTFPVFIFHFKKKQFMYYINFCKCTVGISDFPLGFNNVELKRRKRMNKYFISKINGHCCFAF